MNQEKLQDLIDEFDTCMQAGLDELATDDLGLAEDYFSDAAYVLNQIENEKIKKELQFKYTINPMDFEK